MRNVYLLKIDVFMTSDFVTKTIKAYSSLKKAREAMDEFMCAKKEQFGGDILYDSCGEPFSAKFRRSNYNFGRDYQADITPMNLL